MKTNTTYKPAFIMEILKRVAIGIAAIVVILGFSNATYAQTDDSKHGYVPVNGIDYYYEIHGEGEPLLLLHGGLGSFEKFNSILPMFSEERQVIGMDLHGHGRTELGDRELNFIDMGNDIAAIIKKLGYDQVDVLGYSLGSQVALRLAIQHPEVINRLVLVSTIYSDDGYYPGAQKQQARLVRAEMIKVYKSTPTYKSFVKMAPNPEGFPKLLDQVGNLLTKSFNWSEGVKKLEMPVMLIYGDADMIRLEHVVEFYHLLGGALRDAGWNRQYISQNRLAILPNVTHYDINRSTEMVETALTFFNRKIEQ